jgi:CRP/FNR family transcriptional regulator, cyclic AMP receptor protein
MSKNTSPDSLQNKSEEDSNNDGFQKAAEVLIQRIEAAETTNLLELAKIADLDPKTDFAGGDLRNVDLSGADLTGFDFSHADLSNAELSHANLSHANLLFTNLTDANLSNAIVEKARFRSNLGLSKLMQTDLVRRGARLEGEIREVLLKWDEFQESDRDWMITHGDNKFFQARDVLISQGKLIDTIYIVLDGVLDVVLFSNFRMRTIASIFRTEMVGEMSFVKELPTSATVMAQQDTLVWSIPRSELIRKLKQDSDFGYRFHSAIAAVLAHRLKETTLNLMNKEQADKKYINQDNFSEESTHEKAQASIQQKDVDSNMAKLALGIVSVDEFSAV